MKTTRPITVADLEKARAIVATEPKYVHTDFQQRIGTRNCFCVLGAVAAVRGLTAREDGRLVYKGFDALRLLRNSPVNDACGYDLKTCVDPDAEVTRGQAVDIIDRFIAALRRK